MTEPFCVDAFLADVFDKQRQQPRHHHHNAAT